MVSSQRRRRCLKDRALLGLPVIGLAAVTALGSCRNSTEPTPGRIVIVSRVEALFPGQQESLLIAIDSVLLDPGAAEWTSLEPGVVAVDTAGVVAALQVGTARIVASAPTGSDTIALQVIDPPSGRIVFVGIEQEPQPGDAFRLYEIQANGQGLRPLGFSDIGNPAISPDGTMLAVSVGDLPRILVLSADATRFLYEPTRGLGCGAGTPAWAPDSRSVAFSSCASGQFEVWLSSLDGSSRRQLTQFGGFTAQSSSFTPDGAALIVEVFVQDSGATNPQAGQTELFRVDTATGALVRLTTTPEHELEPFVDIGRSRLYYSRTLPNAPASRPTAPATAVFRSDLEVQASTQVTDLGIGLAGFADAANYPSTSPDGEWLVFSFTTESYALPGMRLGDYLILNREEIHVMRLADRVKVRLTHFWSANQPAWAP